MVLFRFEIFLNGKRRVVDLPRAGKVTIGRSNSDLCLDDSTVSMDHATLLINVGTCLVADRASVNGTVINGTPISEGELRHGDLLQLGAARLKFIEVPELEGEEGAIVAGVVRGGDPQPELSGGDERRSFTDSRTGPVERAIDGARFDQTGNHAPCKDWHRACELSFAEERQRDRTHGIGVNHASSRPKRTLACDEMTSN